jgi:hypothetical protein
MDAKYVNILVRWDHGFEYTTKMFFPSNQRINSWAKHLYSISQVKDLKITNDKNELILDKKSYVVPTKIY